MKMPLKQKRRQTRFRRAYQVAIGRIYDAHVANPTATPDELIPIVQQDLRTGNPILVWIISILAQQLVPVIIRFIFDRFFSALPEGDEVISRSEFFERGNQVRRKVLDELAHVDDQNQATGRAKALKCSAREMGDASMIEIMLAIAAVLEALARFWDLFDKD